jgi:hypothetical protein
MRYDDDFCSCGSGERHRDLYDARGIYVARVCRKCEGRVRSKYRPEIFEDPNYWTDEPVDED